MDSRSEAKFIYKRTFHETADVQLCYIDLAGAEDPARFMTITFNCSPEMQAQSPGVVHVDGTVRPQLVDEEISRNFCQILQAYYRRTGIPSLINTRFNLHGKPIVCTLEDALRSFQQGNLDYLAICDWLVAHPVVSKQQRSTPTRVYLDQ